MKNLNQMKKIVQGIITPLVTPLIDNSRLDIAGLERLIEHVISGGVHGIFILVTTRSSNLARRSPDRVDSPVAQDNQ